MEGHLPRTEHPHMHGISHIHSDHDKYSMVLACFIVLMVFLIIVMVLLGVSAHRQGNMLNNSNAAMAQINTLKKALLTSKGAQKLGVSRPNPSSSPKLSRKGGFSNGLMGTDGAHRVGSYISGINAMGWGSDAGSRLAQTNQGGMSNITGQGLQGTISGDCSTGACNVYDDFMAYSTGGGGMPLPASSAGAEDNENLDFFKSLGTISGDITLAKTNAQNQMANMQSQRRM